MNRDTQDVRRPHIPRDRDNDYTEAMAAQRREFVREHSGIDLLHVGRYSVDPNTLLGNIEGFIGVAQVPLGIAGPLRVNGEHARGDFLIPIATTEGTLVASYSRGMRVLSACGGVKTTVVVESMQRAPVFLFSDARDDLAHGVTQGAAATPPGSAARVGAWNAFQSMG